MLRSQLTIESLRGLVQGTFSRQLEVDTQLQHEVAKFLEAHIVELQKLEADLQAANGNDPVRRVAQLRERMLRLQELSRRRDELQSSIRDQERELELLSARLNILRDTELRQTEGLQSLVQELQRYLIDHESTFSSSARRAIRSKLFQPERLYLEDIIRILYDQIEENFNRPEIQNFYIELQEENARVLRGEYSDQRVAELENSERNLQILLYEEFLDRKSFVLEKARTVSQELGPLSPEFVFNTLPEVQYIDTLDEIFERYAQSFPLEGITLPELRHNVIGFFNGFGMEQISQKEVANKVQNMPSVLEGNLLKYEAEIALGSEVAPKMAKVLFITFPGFVYFLENYLILSSSNQETVQSPVQSRTNAEKVKLPPVEETKLVVSVSSLDALIERYRAGRTPFRIVRKNIPSLEESFYETGTTEDQAVAERDHRPNPLSVSLSYIEYILPGLREAFSLASGANIKHVFEKLVTELGFQVGPENDYYQYRQRLYITEKGFRKLLQVMLHEQAQHPRPLVNAEVVEYLQIQPSYLDEFFAGILKEFDRPIYISHAPYALYAELLDIDAENPSAPGLFMKHSNFTTVARMILHSSLRENPGPIALNRARNFVYTRKSELRNELERTQMPSALLAFKALRERYRDAARMNVGSPFAQFLTVLDRLIVKLESDPRLKEITLNNFFEIYMIRRFNKWHFSQVEVIANQFSLGKDFDDQQLHELLQTSNLVEGVHFRLVSTNNSPSPRVQLVHEIPRLLRQKVAENLKSPRQFVTLLNEVAAELQNQLTPKKEPAKQLPSDKGYPNATATTEIALVQESEAIQSESIVENAIETPDIEGARLLAVIFSDGLQYAEAFYNLFTQLLPKKEKNGYKAFEAFEQHVERQILSENWNLVLISYRDLLLHLAVQAGKGNSFYTFQVDVALAVAEIDLHGIPELSALVADYEKNTKGEFTSLLTYLEERLNTESLRELLQTRIDDLTEDDLVSYMAEILHIPFEPDTQSSEEEQPGEQEVVTLYMAWDVRAEKVAELEESNLYRFVVENLSTLDQMATNLFLDSVFVEYLGEENYRHLIAYAGLGDEFYDKTVRENLQSDEATQSNLLLQSLLKKLDQSDPSVAESVRNDIYSIGTPFSQLLAMVLWNPDMIQFARPSDKSEESEDSEEWTLQTMTEYLYLHAHSIPGSKIDRLDLESIFTNILSLKKVHGKNFPAIQLVLDRLAFFGYMPRTKHFSTKQRETITFRPDYSYRIVLRQDPNNDNLWTAVHSGTTEKLSGTTPSGFRIRNQKA